MLDEDRVVQIKLTRRNKESFECAFDTQFKEFKKLTSLVNYVHTRLSGDTARKATSLRVFYRNREYNETVTCHDTTYLISTLLVFLEDNLSKSFVNTKLRKLK